MVQVRSLAWELPHALAATKKKKKKTSDCSGYIHCRGTGSIPIWHSGLKDLAAIAWIQSLAQEVSCASGMAIKKKKKIEATIILNIPSNRSPQMYIVIAL